MPRLGDMENGTLVRWLANHEGTVNEGEIILEIETEKANVEIEAPASGRLAILVPAGKTVPVGTVLATIA
jgi:pyruvate/2-oxoglutarate dehydrogenase complex dihydrolipoamide acyltransferase (E2) component